MLKVMGCSSMYRPLIAMFCVGVILHRVLLMPRKKTNGHGVDNIFFKYMCGMQNFDFIKRFLGLAMVSEPGDFKSKYPHNV